MDLSAVLTLLRRWSVTLIASAVVAGAVAFVVASRVPPTYAAEAQILVGPINTDGNTLRAAQDLVQTYGQLVTSDLVIESVIERLDLDETPAVLREAITARAESATRLLVLRALAGDPETAAAIANGAAAALDEVASQGQTRPEGEVLVVSVAQPDPAPVQPLISVITVLAAAAGLVAALAVVVLIDYFSDAVSGREDLQRLAQAPFLGSITPSRRFRQRRDRPLIVEAEPDSRAALAYRLIATHISAGVRSGSVRRVVVLGAEGHEGSGEFASNLAAVLVRAGCRVRLVDANDEDREITRLFGLNATLGLGELARGDEAVILRMVARVAPGIEVLPRLPGRDPRLHDDERAPAILDRLMSGTDVVILSTAPIHRSASALFWARDADGAILVATRDRTTRDAVTVSVETLRIIGTPVLGAVLHASSRRPTENDVTARGKDSVPPVALEPANAAEAETLAKPDSMRDSAEHSG